MTSQYLSKQNTKENRQPNAPENNLSVKTKSNTNPIPKVGNNSRELDHNQNAISLSYKLANIVGNNNGDLSDSDSFESSRATDNIDNLGSLTNESSISDASHSRLRESHLPPLIKSGRPRITLDFSLSESEDAPSRLANNEKLPDLEQKSKQNIIRQPPPRDTKSKRRNRRDKDDDDLIQQGLLSNPESMIQDDEKASSSDNELEIQTPIKSRAPRRKPPVPRQIEDKNDNNKDSDIKPENVIPELMNRLMQQNQIEENNNENENNENPEEEQNNVVEEEEEEKEKDFIASRITAESRASQIGVVVIRNADSYSLGRIAVVSPRTIRSSQPFYSNVDENNKDEQSEGNTNEQNEVEPAEHDKEEDQANDQKENQANDQEENQANDKEETQDSDKEENQDSNQEEKDVQIGKKNSKDVNNDSSSFGPSSEEEEESKSVSIHFDSKSENENNSKKGDLDKLMQYLPFASKKHEDTPSSSFSLDLDNNENNKKAKSTKDNLDKSNVKPEDNQNEEEEDNYSSDDAISPLSSSVEGPIEYLDEKPEEIIDTTVTRDELLMPGKIGNTPRYHYDPDFDDTLLEPQMIWPEEDREELYAEVDGLGTEAKSSACLLL